MQKSGRSMSELFAKAVQRLRHLSLTSRLLAVLVLLVAVSVVTTGAVQAYFSYQDSKDSLFRLQREKAKSLATAVQDFFGAEIKRLRTVGPGALLSNSDLGDQLDNLVASASETISASYYDGSGKLRVTTVQPSVPRAARCGQGYSAGLIAQVTAFNPEPYFALSPVYRCAASSAQSVVRMATPESAPGNGVVEEQLDVSSFRTLIANARIGEAGYAFALDLNGRAVVAHPNFEVYRSRGPDPFTLPQVQKAAVSPGRGSMVGRDLKGREVLSAYATIEPIGWTVFVDQPLSEALAPLRASLWRTAILLGAFLLLAVAVSLVLARRFVRPVRRLQVAAERIGGGAYEERIELRRGDELGALADEFNRMAASLQELIGGLEQKVAERTHELELASKHKSAFLANMSHELRTPLNAIVGFSQVLREKLFGDINAKQEEYLDDILSSANHLLSLINDILDLSKVEAGQVELELGTFSLKEALENGVVMIRERATTSGVELELTVDPNIDLVPGDERRIRQVIFNLLSNAAKFTPEGGRIDVSAAQVDGEVRIAVRDTGPGIAPADQERIFEEFQQAQPTDGDRPEGTGLGLALSKRLVELHGGRLWVESQLGEGSTFAFTLPLGQR